MLHVVQHLNRDIRTSMATAELYWDGIQLEFEKVMLQFSDQPPVLIVEDDPALRELYRSAFKSAGYSVTAVGDGADALRVIEQRPPQAVVLDLALPYVSGLDVHRELRARPETCHIPVVIVSGTDTSGVDRGDFIKVLSKPVSPDVVVNAVALSVKKKAGL